MKIAIDVSQMCYEGTGVARYVQGLSRAMLEANSGHEFLLYAGVLRRRSFFTTLQHTMPWDQASWRLLPLPPKLAGLALNLFPIRIDKLVGKVDLLHTSDWTEPSTNYPTVTTVHDLVFKKYPETVDACILKTQTRRLAKIAKSQTQIIADSMSTKNDLMEIYHLDSARITVVHPGIDKQYVPQSKKEIDRVKTKYHLPDKFVLSVGTQEPRKNMARLIEATSKLNIPLVLIGKYGWGDPNIPGLKGDHKPGMYALGYVPDSDLPALYCAAAVFAYPSLYEGFGFPVLEAMACGTPVVTSNLSSLPEVAGDAGVLVDPIDVSSISSGINFALNNRMSLIKKGIQQAQKFTWERAAKQVLEVYEKTARRD